jgi:hypothetical protein
MTRSHKSWSLVADGHCQMIVEWMSYSVCSARIRLRNVGLRFLSWGSSATRTWARRVRNRLCLQLSAVSTFRRIFAPVSVLSARFLYLRGGGVTAAVDRYRPGAHCNRLDLCRYGCSSGLKCFGDLRFSSVDSNLLADADLCSYVAKNAPQRGRRYRRWNSKREKAKFLIGQRSKPRQS